MNRDGIQCPVEDMTAQALAFPSFTAELDGQPIGCAGIVMPWPGVGMVWMILSEDMESHGLWMTRTVKTFLAYMERVYQLHRLEAVALQESPRNQAWMTALGFQQERDGLATGYLPDGRSMVRYERVKGL